MDRRGSGCAAGHHVRDDHLSLPGLQPFGQRDAGLFFGRESAVTEVMDVMARHLQGPVGFQNSATGPELGLCRPLILVDEAAEDGPTVDPHLGEVGDRVIGPGRVELEAAMGPPSVVVGRVLVQDRPQMPLAEDQYPVSDLLPGSEHEPFGMSVTSHRQLRPIRMIGTDAPV